MNTLNKKGKVLLWIPAMRLAAVFLGLALVVPDFKAEGRNVNKEELSSRQTLSLFDINPQESKVKRGEDLHKNPIAIATDKRTKTDSYSKSDIFIAQNQSSSTVTDRPELLQNPSFEGTYSERAPGWQPGYWGGAVGTISREIDEAYDGSSAQKLTVTALPEGSAFFLKQDYRVLGNRVYQARFFLKAAAPLKVRVMIRKQEAWWEPYAIQTVKVGTSWQEVTIKGGTEMDTDTYIAVEPQETGTLWVDKASLMDVTDYTAEPVPSTTIPAQLFGMHIICWGCFQFEPWPLTHTNARVLRLWDMGAKWMDLELANDVWDLERLRYFDYYVDNARAANPNISLIYTLGQPPAWAARDPSVWAAYGSGASSEPASLEDWRDYVRTLGLRYKGKIRYWQVWNEADNNMFYQGSIASMVELTRIARQELKAIDPANMILSPSITRLGMYWLNDFLFQGGGKSVDVITYQRYLPLSPEPIIPELIGLRSLMKSYGIGHKPLWNTEGANAWNSEPPTDEQARATVARTYLIQWSFGVANFNWYGWEVRYDWQNGTALSTPDNKTLYPAGIAYREIFKWLTGARMVKRVVNDDGLWLIEIERNNGYKGRILWNTSSSQIIDIPSEWGAISMRTLSGEKSNARGMSSLLVGVEPILLENR